jgi:predicted kinase
MDSEALIKVRHPPLLVLVTGLPGTGKSTVAEMLAHLMASSVLNHDWVMSGLVPFPQIQASLDLMGASGRGPVGWSVLNALAQAQLRAGRSAVLDGVARSPEVLSCRASATQESADFLLISTRCSDQTLHRSRIEGRARRIPNWYELDWEQVERSAANWDAPTDADLELDTAEDRSQTLRRITAFLNRVMTGLM